MVQGTTKSEDMVGACTGRAFERLLGYVDFEAFSTDDCESLAQESTKFSLPICMCHSPSELEIQMFEILSESIQTNNRNDVSQAIKAFADLVSSCKNSDEPPKEQMRQLEKAEESVDALVYRIYNMEDKGVGQLSENDEELLETSKDKANKLKRTLAMQIRFATK